MSNFLCHSTGYRNLILALALAFFVCAGVSRQANAYIPRGRTILARTAKGGGKGLYAIDQDVQFRSLTEPITLHERWFVENGENLRLYVTSTKSSKDVFRYDILYRGGRKTAPDSAGTLQVTNTPVEFIEGFEHFRSSSGLLEALERAHILPASFSRGQPKITTVAAIKHVPEPYLRLGRSGGVVSWIFGDPTPVDGARLNPEAWVSQDAFVLQKLRFPSQAEVTAEKFSTISNLRFPRERTVTWNNNTVVIRVLSVKPAGASPAMAKIFSSASLTAADARAARLPDQQVVKEFYSRFR